MKSEKILSQIIYQRSVSCALQSVPEERATSIPESEPDRNKYLRMQAYARAPKRVSPRSHGDFVFASEFESGNLETVYQVGPAE